MARWEDTGRGAAFALLLAVASCSPGEVTQPPLPAVTHEVTVDPPSVTVLAGDSAGALIASTAELCCDVVPPSDRRLPWGLSAEVRSAQDNRFPIQLAAVGNAPPDTITLELHASDDLGYGASASLFVEIGRPPGSEPVFVYPSYTIPLPRTPWGLALSPDGGTAFVLTSTHQWEYDGVSNVMVVDLGQETVTTSVPVGALDLAVAPTGDFLYATNLAYSNERLPVSTAVLVLDADTYTVLDSIPLRRTVDEVRSFLASTTGDRLYLYEASFGLLSVVDLGVGAVVASVQVGTQRGSELTLVSDGSAAYLWGPGEVREIDLATYEIVQSLSFDLPEGVTTSPDGSVVYVQGRNTFYAVDRATGTLTDSLAMEGFGPAWVTPSGDRAFLNSGSVVDLDVFEETNYVDLVRGRRLLSSPAGDLVYFGVSDGIGVIDIQARR